MTFCHIVSSGTLFVKTLKEKYNKNNMYRGFDLEEITFDSTNSHHWYDGGRKLFDDNKQKVMTILKDYTLNEGVLNGSKMQSDWFPQIDSHIFISHSHKDEEAVITLTGWLYEKFGLIAFIDSCVWGNTNDLLRIIDNKYCLQSDVYYNYEKRNYSTSHVHMMLSTALTQMIDKSECLFFYNTPQSISSASIISKTESPWIYSEITMSQLLRHKVPDRRRFEDTRMFSKGGSINEQLRVEYELDLTHLTTIEANSLNLWGRCGQKKEAALDELYKLKPLKKSDIIYG